MSMARSVDVRLASDADAEALAAMRTAVAHDLSKQFGHGHWSSIVTVKSVLRGLPHARVLVACEREAIVGTLRMATKKPWAIDRAYFVEVPRPLYLTDMAVAPARQRHDIGRHLIEAAKKATRDWPAQAIRLDAYDGLAGAGPFYVRCGFAEAGRVTYRGVPLVYYEWLVSGARS
jgi:GNAT superfamily N-acetyltransferase